MAKMLSNLQTGTRVYLDEATAADFLDTEVTRSINYAYHDVIKSVMEVYENYYETTSPVTYAVVANQQEYTIDPSFIKVTRVEINYKPTDANSKPVRALPVKADEVLTNLAFNNTAGSFFNAGYYLHGVIGAQQIGFIPIPTIADTTGQSIAVWGITLPNDLVSGGDNVNIPWADNFSQLVELKAAAILLSKGQQSHPEALQYLALYDKGIKDMQNFLKLRQADGMWMIEDQQLENIDFGSLGFS